MPDLRRVGRHHGFDAWEIDLHGHQVVYRVAGSGPPVVLVHGMVNSSRHWQAVAERLRRRALDGGRDDGARLALAIEGGGMRGAVSAGMAIAIDELGLTDAFDAVYGASAGALNGVWLLSGNPADGLRPAGRHAVVFDGDGWPSGVYFYRLRAGRFVESGKMVMLQ